MRRNILKRLKDSIGRGDERTLVTLFCIVSAILLLASVYLTDRFLTVHDSLIRYVPADAVAYLHSYRLPGGDDRLSIIPIPDDLRPDETARYAYRNPDDTIVWGTVIAWHDTLDIAPHERMIIDGLGMHHIDDRTFIIADEGGLPRWSSRQEESLAADERIASSLDVARSIATSQGYISALLLSDTLLSDAVSDSVLGISVSDDTVRAMMIPLADASRMKFGFRFHADAQYGSLTHTSTSGDIIINASPLPFDPLMAFFGELVTTVEGHDTPASIVLRTAKNDLVRMMEGATSFALTMQGDGAISRSLFIPDIDAKPMIDTIRSYFQAAYPLERTVTLPDGEKVRELILDDKRFPAERLGIHGVPPIYRVMIEEVGYSSVIMEAQKGVILATDVNTALSSLEEAADRNCLPSLPSDADVHLTDATDLLPSSANELIQMIFPLQMNYIHIQNIGDKFTYFCGYSPIIVDN